MKKFQLILLAIVLFSCRPIISNDQQTLDKIFSKERFEIELHNLGCFGGREDLLSLTREGDHYILKSEKTGKHRLVEASAVDSLKSFLEPRIGKDLFGGCTTSSYVRVGTHFSSVDYNHSYCSGKEALMISELLDYGRIIYDENE